MFLTLRQLTTKHVKLLRLGSFSLFLSCTGTLPGDSDSTKVVWFSGSKTFDELSESIELSKNESEKFGRPHVGQIEFPPGSS